MGILMGIVLSIVMSIVLLACHTEDKPEPQPESAADSAADSADSPADSRDTPPDSTDSPVESQDSPVDTGTTYPCGPALTIRGRVTGAAAADPQVRVAILDAATWRLGDAPDLSQSMRWEAATGEFALCLDAAPAILDLYTKGFAAAWVDRDGDGRYDAATERLCDLGAEGWTPEYLLYRQNGLWSVGLGRTAEGDVGGAFAPVLSGDGC